ncbi:MAG: thiolase family protein [Deltaproteobacteria bacterium]|nr:thiolase family protein [Deltaproteobacteria bacterium]MBI3387588.1 thiolase family protein [Deltaproteobacteria bacterium]
MMSLRGKAAAIGIAEMRPVKDMGGLTPLAIMARMARAAIDDAGLEPRDIGGLLCGVPVGDTGMIYPGSVVEYLGLSVRYLDVVDIGGASSAGMMWRAAAAIDAGMCHTVLCVAGDTFGRVPGSHWPAISLTREFEAPYGPAAANTGYALIAQRHMFEYGTTPEQLAKIAVDQRTNALKNPNALFGVTPITVDDVLRSPLIVDPLHLLEIVKPCTGGAAYIMTGKERALRAPHPPVWLLGAGEHCRHSNITYSRDITTSPISVSAPAAFAMAGLTPRDMHFVQPYDCYTITVCITLEDAGFCQKGQGGRFVAEHDLTYAGDLPCNTHGGQLSFGQPGLAGGMTHVIEGIRQLMGRGGERQVRDAQLGFVNGNGGIMSEQCSLVLSREA